MFLQVYLNIVGCCVWVTIIFDKWWARMNFAFLTLSEQPRKKPINHSNIRLNYRILYVYSVGIRANNRRLSWNGWLKEEQEKTSSDLGLWRESGGVAAMCISRLVNVDESQQSSSSRPKISVFIDEGCWKLLCMWKKKCVELAHRDKHDVTKVRRLNAAKRYFGSILQKFVSPHSSHMMRPCPTGTHRIRYKRQVRKTKTLSEHTIQPYGTYSKISYQSLCCCHCLLMMNFFLPMLIQNSHFLCIYMRENFL